VSGDQDPIVKKLARSQDQIGWRRFMEGMISKEFCEIQEVVFFLVQNGLKASLSS